MERQPSIGPFEADFAPPGGIRHIESRDRAVDRMDTHGRLRDPAPGDTTTVRAGGRLFGIYCAPCHGPGGAGDGPVTEKFIPPPPLFPLVGGRTDGYLYGTIRFGGPIMPPYGEELQDGEIWSIIRWLRRESARRTARGPGG
jgi:mono/diheme cytochrome c family protein